MEADELMTAQLAALRTKTIGKEMRKGSVISTEEFKCKLYAIMEPEQKALIEARIAPLGSDLREIMISLLRWQKELRP